MSIYIKKLILEGEHQSQDFKFAINDSKKIARTLSAFANTDGGKLLIGVKDNGKIAGVSSDEEYYMVESAAHLYCNPVVEFKCLTHFIEGKTVLEIDVLPSINSPHFAPDSNGKWKAFVRVNDQNLLANSTLIKLWKRRKDKNPSYIEFSKNEKLLLEYLEINEKITLKHFAKISSLPKYIAEDILVNLLNIKVIYMQITVKHVFFRKSILKID